VEALAEALASLPIAGWVRVSRWGYAAVSGGHVLGVALLVGAIVPLDLRLVGAWRSVPHAALVRVLVPVAAGGLGLAVVTGGLLLLARPDVYLAMPLFLAKLGLIAAGVAHAVSVHLSGGLAAASAARLRRTGLVSLAVWPTVLGLGRGLAFVDP